MPFRYHTKVFSIHTQLKKLRQVNQHQTLLILNLTKLIGKNSNDCNVDLSDESNSYLKILKLIALKKCGLPPQKEDAQLFVKNLLTLFFESLARPSENDTSDTNDDVPQQIKLALGHCGQTIFNEYESNFINTENYLLCNDEKNDEINGNNLKTPQIDGVVENKENVDEVVSEPSDVSLSNSSLLCETTDQTVIGQRRRTVRSDAFLQINSTTFNEIDGNSSASKLQSTPLESRSLRPRFQSISHINIENQTGNLPFVTSIQTSDSVNNSNVTVIQSRNPSENITPSVTTVAPNTDNLYENQSGITLVESKNNLDNNSPDVTVINQSSSNKQTKSHKKQPRKRKAKTTNKEASTSKTQNNEVADNTNCAEKSMSISVRKGRNRTQIANISDMEFSITRYSLRPRTRQNQSMNKT